MQDGPPILPLQGAGQQADAHGLTALVYPHYFRARTMALGRYFGIYLPDATGRTRLAAMIGERLGVPATASRARSARIRNSPASGLRGA